MLALVVPLYNEENRFDIDSWSLLIEAVDNCRWYFVNDGSTDSTAMLLSRLNYSNVRVFNLPKNVGKGEAVRYGMVQAVTSDLDKEVELVGYLDCDGAFDFLEIPGIIGMAKTKLCEESFTLVIASRVKLSGRNVQRNSTRHYLGRIIATFICMGWLNAPYDTQSGFKIFRITTKNSCILRQPFRTRWFFDIELMMRMEELSLLAPWELTVSTWRDVKGSKLRLSQFFGVLIEILWIRRVVKSVNKSNN